MTGEAQKMQFRNLRKERSDAGSTLKMFRPCGAILTVAAFGRRQGSHAPDGKCIPRNHHARSLTQVNCTVFGMSLQATLENRLHCYRLQEYCQPALSAKLQFKVQLRHTCSWSFRAVQVNTNL